jgi:hypothetical protein
VTFIVSVSVLVLLSIAVVAGVLFWSSARRAPTAHGPPPLFYPMDPSPRTHADRNAAQRLDDRPVARPLAVEPPRVKYGPATRPLDAEHDNAETVRFVRPSDFDAAVQLLPGHLEVLGGETPHREIRFMRVPGESPHVILGRELRHAPHYVGLGSPTVSRRHARFDFADNQWIVKNLSHTNPLVVNDDELFDTDVARPLADGDRLELGDVVLRFHAQ